MIIWQGLGFLAMVFPILGYVGLALLMRALEGPGYIDQDSWPGALGTLIGAACVWILGQRLSLPGRLLVDPANGQRVVLKKKHTFFFIPMTYCAYILALVAVGMLVFRTNSPL